MQPTTNRFHILYPTTYGDLADFPTRAEDPRGRGPYATRRAARRAADRLEKMYLFPFVVTERDHSGNLCHPLIHLEYPRI